MFKKALFHEFIIVRYHINDLNFHSHHFTKFKIHFIKLKNKTMRPRHHVIHTHTITIYDFANITRPVPKNETIHNDDSNFNSSKQYLQNLNDWPQQCCQIWIRKNFSRLLIHDVNLLIFGPNLISKIAFTSLHVGFTY